MSHSDDVFMKHFRNVMIGLALLFVIVLVLAQIVAGLMDENISKDPARQQALQERIAPVAQVNIAGVTPPPVAPDAAGGSDTAAKSGAEVVASSCAACHQTGAAGAPKIGDTAVWQARYAEGLDTLVANAINGKGGMPAKGGNAALSDAEVKAAVVDMLSNSGIEGVAGQAAPAAAGAAAAAPAAAAATATAQAAAGPDAAAGEAVYKQACFACHDSGAAGAPKLADKAVWAPRIALGMPALTTAAVSGKGAMPPKGGAMQLSDAQVADAVAYMVSKSR